MAPTVLGVELGAPLGPLDGAPEPPGEPVGAPLAAEPEHAARTTTRAARAAGRDIIDMAAGTPDPSQMVPRAASGCEMGPKGLTARVSSPL